MSNPPFVPGPARVEFVYRDSGEDGDAALAALVGDLAGHLAPGGVAQLLASWLHVRGEDWPDRVRSWLPAGCDAWVVQREVADPALHVGTWQRDGGLDPASPAGPGAGAGLAGLDGPRGGGGGRVRPAHAAAHRRAARPWFSRTSAEPFDDPLGPEVEGWLDRVDWLRAHADDAALLSARLTLAPRCCWSAGRSPAPKAGRRWAQRWPARTGRGGGTRWTARPRTCWRAATGALPLGELVELLAIANDRPTDALVAAALPAVREFVRHGLLAPSAEAG